MTTADALAALLRDRGAENVEHPGGSLDAHLGRVQARLADLGMPEPVQPAGRAHAVHGTDCFDLVNEIDVAEHAAGFLGQHGAYFRRLADEWSPVLNPAVAAEARRVFA